jgi:hypothetical protein
MIQIAPTLFQNLKTGRFFGWPVPGEFREKSLTLGCKSAINAMVMG